MVALTTAMIIEDSFFHSRTTGTEIFRRTARPPDSVAEKGTVLVLHGLGDNMDCHLLAMELFADLGYRSAGFDWPGNGKSEGRRGDIPSVAAAAALIGEFLEDLPGPVAGWYAHSTGAFLLLTHLEIHPEQVLPGWIWLSSPLINPVHNQPPWKVRAANFLSRHLPGVTIPTGVKPNLCYHGEEIAVPRERKREFHSRISLRFARDLVHWAPKLEDAASRIDAPVSLLVTQGKDDRICPPPYSERWFESVATPGKTMLTFDGIRHEPLREPDNEAFLEAVKSWFEGHG